MSYPDEKEAEEIAAAAAGGIGIAAASTSTDMAGDAGVGDGHGLGLGQAEDEITEDPHPHPHPHPKTAAGDIDIDMVEVDSDIEAEAEAEATRSVHVDIDASVDDEAVPGIVGSQTSDSDTPEVEAEVGAGAEAETEANTGAEVEVELETEAEIQAETSEAEAEATTDENDAEVIALVDEAEAEADNSIQIQTPAAEQEEVTEVQVVEGAVQAQVQLPEVAMTKDAILEHQKQFESYSEEEEMNTEEEEESLTEGPEPDTQINAESDAHENENAEIKADVQVITPAPQHVVEEKVTIKSQSSTDNDNDNADASIPTPEDTSNGSSGGEASASASASAEGIDISQEGNIPNGNGIGSGNIDAVNIRIEANASTEIKSETETGMNTETASLSLVEGEAETKSGESSVPQKSTPAEASNTSDVNLDVDVDAGKTSEISIEDIDLNLNHNTVDAVKVIAQDTTETSDISNNNDNNDDDDEPKKFNKTPLLTPASTIAIPISVPIPTPTTTSTTDPKARSASPACSDSSESSQSSDEEEKIATQMAAVALAATAKTSDLKSPSAAANYAKDISKGMDISPPHTGTGTSSGTGAGKIGNVASAAANATIVAIPPAGGVGSHGNGNGNGNTRPLQINSHNQTHTHTAINQRRRKNRRIPVHASLVQKIIARQCIEKERELQQRLEEERQRQEMEHIHMSSTHSDFDDDMNSTLGLGMGLQQSHSHSSDITFTAAYTDHNHHRERAHTSGTINTNATNANSHSGISATISMTTTSTCAAQATPSASIMQQQLAKGHNVNFLKHLLLLNNHTCILPVSVSTSTSSGQASGSGSNSGPDVSLLDGVSANERERINGNASDGSGSVSVASSISISDSEISLSLADSGDSTDDDDNLLDINDDADPSGLRYTPEERETASEAASLALDTLTQMDRSYNYLLDLITIHNAKVAAGNDSKKNSNGASASAGVSADQETDISIGSDMDGLGSSDIGGSGRYDPNASYSNMSFESTRVIPDLLPPCTSIQGDSTALFFQACAPIEVEEERTSTTSLPVSASASAAAGKKVDDAVGAGSGQGQGAPAKAEKSAVETASTGTGNKELKKNVLAKDGKQTHAAAPPSAPTARTVASTIMSSVFRRSRNKQLQQQQQQQKNDDDASVATASTAATSTTKLNDAYPSSGANEATGNDADKYTRIGADYNVTIVREMLGLTVENVLERTVVRTVLPSGAAKKAGTKVGSLVVKVGSVETANLTHFETIDELRQSQRPLKLVLRRISKDALRGAREEMGRLIRGGGFGTASLSMDHNNAQNGKDSDDMTLTDDESMSRGDDSVYMDAYIKMIQEQWLEGTKRKLHTSSLNKRDEALSHAGAKLAWILSILVIGLEREAVQSRSFGDDDLSFASQLSDFDHYSKDYADAAKSVSKILHDYAKKHFEREPRPSKNTNQATPALNAMHMKRKRQIAPPPHIQNKQRQAVPGASKRSVQNKGTSNATSPVSASESVLLQIGDVLHRARSFLADPASPPAAILRGEVIALLCDILDLDNDMTLSEEESASSSTDKKGGMINDLGSAGSLLKLIVLNCSMMRSSGCVDDDEETHAAHAGNRFLAVVHRLAASRSISARVTACSLGPVLWGHLDFPHQLQLRGVITRALHDVEVLVRKSTAAVLHEIAELVFDSRAVRWLVLMCERAMTDPEPQLRAAAMTLTFHLAEHLPNAFLGDASEGSRSIRGLPSREDPTFAEVYLLQCKLLPVATRLADDGTASVRLAVAAQCDRLAKAMGEHWHSIIIDLLQSLLADKDSRVRGEAAMCIPRLAESILSGVSPPSTSGNIFVLESLLPVALKLQKDPTTDVRMCLAAASGELLSYLVWLQHLAEESESHSQNQGETSENANADTASQKRYIDDTLIPLLQNLLQDPDPEVTSAALRAVTNASRGHGRDRENRTRQRTLTEDDSVSLSSQSHQSYLIEKRDPVFRPVLSEAQVLRLVPTLSELSSSAQWRVRQSAVEIVPALLGCTHKLETRSDIAQLCVKLMGDSVDAVRKSAAECLCLGGSNLGSDESSEAHEWLEAVVMPHLGGCQQSSNSKQRLLCLKMVEMILVDVIRPGPESYANGGSKGRGNRNVASSSMARKALEMAGDLSDDKIVNVRLNVGRMFGNVINTLSLEDLEYVIIILESQIEEEVTQYNGGDRDVLYFAKRSIYSAKERLNIAAVSVN